MTARVPVIENLVYDDAVALAKGCHDYGGGYRDGAASEAFHHGIDTVLNVLKSARKDWTIQTNVVFNIGRQALKDEA